MLKKSAVLISIMSIQVIIQLARSIMHRYPSPREFSGTHLDCRLLNQLDSIRLNSTQIDSRVDTRVDTRVFLGLLM